MINQGNIGETFRKFIIDYFWYKIKIYGSSIKQQWNIGIEFSPASSDVTQLSIFFSSHYTIHYQQSFKLRNKMKSLFLIFFIFLNTHHLISNILIILIILIHYFFIFLPFFLCNRFLFPQNNICLFFYFFYFKWYPNDNDYLWFLFIIIDFISQNGLKTS